VSEGRCRGSRSSSSPARFTSAGRKPGQAAASVRATSVPCRADVLWCAYARVTPQL
jgi:hypothetical protein